MAPRQGKLSQLGYRVYIPDKKFFIFFRAGCYCGADRCWCTVPTSSYKGHPRNIVFKLGQYWVSSQQWNKPKTRPPVRCGLLATGKFDDYNSLGVESRTMTAYNNSSGAPAENRQALPPPTAFPVRSVLGRDGPPPAGELGPTSLLLRKAQPRPAAGITSMRDRARFHWSGGGEICQWCGGSEAQQMAVAAWARVDDAHLTSSGPSP